MPGENLRINALHRISKILPKFKIIISKISCIDRSSFAKRYCEIYSACEKIGACEKYLPLVFSRCRFNQIY